MRCVIREHQGSRTYIIVPDDRNDAASRLRQNAQRIGVIRVESHKQLLFRDGKAKEGEGGCEE